ncbi:hypothetical protein [Hyalangium gracile]|uniref:hypothetical protein n=1 Tax=Hyalangium gracile TaxID=394092 RepID=UPI001CCBF7A7|nr:hypothetical protein [Hyalangium gracile]
MNKPFETPTRFRARSVWLAACTSTLVAAMTAGCGAVELAEPEVAPAVEPLLEPVAQEALNPERRGIGAEPLPERQGPSAQAVTVDARRSLAVTDQAILSQFTFQEVMDQLVAQAGIPGLTRLQLFQQWWDTQRPAPGLGLGPHCTDAGIANMNGFPYACPRAEGNQATVDPFINPTGPNSYMPIGLFNRFDLAPTNGANCGEYRILFARRGGVTDGARNLIIFEAVLPNPSPSRGLHGCRLVANFWANLSANNDVSARAAALKSFYFTGLSGFMPVVHIDNYGNRASNTGQVRTNQFMEFNWLLREFKVKKTCGTACTLQFIPITVKTNPGGSLFSPGSTHALAAEFQATAFPGQVPALAVNNVNTFNMTLADKFNAGESDSQEGPTSDANYSDFFGTGPSTLRTNIQAKIPTSSGLTPDHIVARAKALSCAGCHQLSNGAALGGGITWPNSLGFVHVRESSPEASPEGGTRFVVSPALTSTFLPHRKAVLEHFVNTACGDGVCQSWESATVNSCVIDCGCPPKYNRCCDTCVPSTVQCTDQACPDVVLE